MHTYTFTNTNNFPPFPFQQDLQEASEDDTDLMELLMRNDWTLPNHLLSLRDLPESQQRYESPQQNLASNDHQRLPENYPSYITQNATSISSSSAHSAFAAQFMSGTPEQEMLLRALAEQQESRNLHRRQIQEPHLDTGSSQQSQLIEQPQHHRQLSGYSVNPTPSQLTFSTNLPSAATSQPSLTYNQSPLNHRPHQSLNRQPMSDNELFARQRQSINLGSPQSEIFSSPEDQRRQLTYTPSRASHSSLHSVREDGLQPFTDRSTFGSPSNLPLPSSHQSPLTEQANFPATTDIMSGFVRRGSAEFEALRQRRQVRRTYTGPSSISGFYSPTGRSSDTVGPSSSSQRSVKNTSRRPRPISAGYQGLSMGMGQESGSHSSYEERQIPASASFLSSQSSGVDDGGSKTLSEGTPGTAGRKSEIPPSLSAELAGLGLDADNFYRSTMLQSHSSDDNGEDDVFMDTEADQDNSMQRTSSSSSASTTKRRTAIGDQSLFSQNTTTSSGLDDSMFSTSEVDHSRWIHGRDTPPVSPSRTGSNSSLLVSDHHAMGKKKDVEMTTTTSDMGPSSGFLQPSLKQYAGSRLSVGGIEYPQTWPRTFSTGSSVAAGTMSSSTDSSAQNTPSLSSSTGLFGQERSGNNARSPVQHSRNDNQVHSSRLSPQLRLARSPSNSSSISQQAASTIAAASGATGSTSARRNRPSSRLFTTLDAANRSVESLRSDHAPSLTSRMRSGSNLASGGGGESSARGIERNKRWSTSFINLPSSFDQPSSSRNRRKAGKSAETDQYEEVSNALETLRMFLRQRDGSHAKQNTISLPRRSSSSQFGNLTAMSSEAIQPVQQGFESSSSLGRSDHKKVLRHPPPGPLPPRGSLYDGKEASTLHGHEMQSRSSSHSLSPSASINLSPSSNDSRSQNPTNTFSSISDQLQRQQRQHNRTTSSASIDRIAALEDLADRVRRMREEDRSTQLSMQSNDQFDRQNS